GAIIAWLRRGLPEPFGPMIPWISSALIVRSTPLTISVPSSSATCRFFSSSCDTCAVPNRFPKRFSGRFETTSLAGPGKRPTRGPPHSHERRRRDEPTPQPQLGPWPRRRRRRRPDRRRVLAALVSGTRTHHV